MPLLALLIALALAGGGYVFLQDRPVGILASVDTHGTADGQSTEGFEKAIAPRAFTFPTDHGPHREYQIEWWYYTGSLSSADGRKWGYQLTFFRRGLGGSHQARQSNWGTNEVYLAHFAVTDVAGEAFYAFEQLARGGDIGLAGASGDPYHIFVEDWQATGTGANVRLTAERDGIAIDLQLDAVKPLTLQGEAGLSPKGREPGQATYYYSLTRMATTGSISINGKTFEVEGTSWMDHEWATSPLAPQQVGWDWFGLHLDDGTDVMWYQLRRADGTIDFAAGSITGPIQQTTRRSLSDMMLLTPGDAIVTVLDTWTSPDTGVTYPAAWRLQIPKAGIDIYIKPLVSQQELRLQNTTYWEGAVEISGSGTGRGYAELTGYAGDGSPLR